VGRLSPVRREEVANLLRGLVERDAESVADTLVLWAAHDARVDADQLQQDIAEFVDLYHGVPLGELDVPRMLLDLSAVLRARSLALPAEVAHLIKVFVTVEGTARGLDPGFDMAGEMAPFLQRLVTSRYRPDRLLRGAVRAAADVTQLAAALPRDVRQLVRAVRGGNFRVHLEVDNLRAFSQALDASATRLTLGIVLAALLIGSSITLTVSGGPTLFGLPFFAALGLAGAGFVCFWLLASLARRDRGAERWS
jgi:ubiquinone biosynthesis protein